jgi:PAS domain S-box-containing protein
VGAGDVTRQGGRPRRGEGEERFRLLFEALPVGALLCDPHELRFRAHNEAAARLLGYTREEFASLRWSEIEALPPGAERGPGLAGLLPSGRLEFETRLRTKSGELRDALVRGLAVEGRGETQILVILTDVTEHARAEAQQARAERLRGEIEHRVKNSFALLGILLGVQAAKARSPEAAQALREAEARVRAFAAIHEYIYASRSERTDAAEVIGGVTETMRAALGTQADLVATREGPAQWCASREVTDLALVAHELLTNGLKHGAPDGTGRLRVTVHTAVGEDAFELWVWNSGRPVAAGFRWEEDSRTGLRLVARVVVQDYGGAVSLAPEGEGTLARVTIPLAQLTRAREEEAEGSAE